MTKKRIPLSPAEEKKYSCSQCGCTINAGELQGDVELIEVNDLLCEDCKFEYEKEIREQELLEEDEENDDNEFFE